MFFVFVFVLFCLFFVFFWAAEDLGYTNLGSLQHLLPRDLERLVGMLCLDNGSSGGPASSAASSAAAVPASDGAVKAGPPALPSTEGKYISPLDLGFVTVTDQTEMGQGRGQFGKVFRCHMQEQPCVMKQIPVESGSFQKVMRTLDEARYLMRLKHENIVAYMDVFGHQELRDGHYGSFLCIITELCDRGTLADLVLDHGLSLESALDVTRQVCSGIEYLHITHGMVHRDIKLENILLATGKPTPHPSTESEKQTNKQTKKQTNEILKKQANKQMGGRANKA